MLFIKSILKRAIMETNDYSYGIVPLRLSGADYEILLSKSKRYDYFQIAKGHKEHRETNIQAAIRELQEETGHSPTMFLGVDGWTNDQTLASPIDPIIYVFTSKKGRPIRKHVIYYIALVEKTGEIADTEEVEFVQWFPLNRETGNMLLHRENIEHYNNFILHKLNPHL
ncbi:unnamed protein product [Blepharisma stoltei]|uniref:Nudix hydrolase domain-containing protein n=1 Tax=Blepharisma stoltei TaxID=1481888 RepID=A0AAU9K3Z7_9CILI|nr:unnamed protein product [Blepharisma stoltei]